MPQTQHLHYYFHQTKIIGIFHKELFFRGGGNFGSGVLDALVDGIMVEIIICDTCLIMKNDLTRRVILEKIVRKKVVDKNGKIIKVLE